ncbi:NADAR family protein [Vibrio splendidus]
MRITDKFVFFYTKEDCFSQHSPHGIHYQGLYFPYAESWMMFHKARLMVLPEGSLTEDVKTYMAQHPKSIFEHILKAPTPQRAKMLGANVAPWNQELWNDHCDEIVYYGNLLKFRQNPECKASMIENGQRNYVEASSRDERWGVGLSENDPRINDPINWQGENRLGNILNRVRDTILIEWGIKAPPIKCFEQGSEAN